MKQKSTVINCDPVFCDPSSTPGAITVMRQLISTACPEVNGKKLTLACHGDQMSVERMMNAQQNMIHARNNKDRLQSLCPSPQEFHKEGIIFQV